MYLLYQQGHYFSSVGVFLAPSPPAIFFPNRMFDPLLHMIVEFVGDILLWGPASDIFVLHLFDDLDRVVGDCVEWAHHASVLDRPGRSNKGDEVGEVWNGETEIGFGANFPFFL